MTNALVDSNILIYSVQKREKEKHSKAVRLIAELIEKDELVLSVQNLAEFSRALAEKASPRMPAVEIRKYVEGFSSSGEVKTYGAGTVLKALEIVKGYKLHFFDALLAATMLENGVSVIYTEDTAGFSRIKSISAKNPF